MASASHDGQPTTRWAPLERPLRRSGTLARQVLLVRVGRRRADRPTGRRPDPPLPSPLTAAEIQRDRTDQPRRRSRRARRPPPAWRSRCCPASARSPAGSSSPWSTAARWRASGSACSPSSWPCSGDVRVAAICLVACVAFDGLDGALARKLGVASPFGAQMDSLADMCSFGLAAPVVVYASLAGTVSTPAAAVGLRAGRRLRGDPAGPVQRLAEGRPVLLRRADHDGRRGARAGRADRPAGLGRRSRSPAWRCWRSRWCPASRTPSSPGW